MTRILLIFRTFLSGWCFWIIIQIINITRERIFYPLLAKLSAASVVKVWGAGAPGSGVVVSMQKKMVQAENVIFTAHHVISGRDK